MAIKEAFLLEARRTGLMPQAAEITDLNGIIRGMRQASALMVEWPGCSQLRSPIHLCARVTMSGLIWSKNYLS